VQGVIHLIEHRGLETGGVQSVRHQSRISSSSWKRRLRLSWSSAGLSLLELLIREATPALFVPHRMPQIFGWVGPVENEADVEFPQQGSKFLGGPAKRSARAALNSFLEGGRIVWLAAAGQRVGAGRSSPSLWRRRDSLSFWMCCCKDVSSWK